MEKQHSRWSIVLIIGLGASLILAGCDGAGAGDATPPGEVSALSVNSGDRFVDLSWNAPTDTDVDHIEISWSPAVGEAQPKIVAAGTEATTIAALDNGFEYLFTVKSVDTAGIASAGVTASAFAVDPSALYSSRLAGLTAVENSSSNLADLDGDGSLDLLITGYDGSNATATLYENDGGGSFSDASAGLTGVGSQYSIGSSDVGNIDGNSGLDIVIAGHDGTNPTARVYTNDGSLSFSASDLTDGEFSDGTSSLGDVDGDGDLDLVVFGYDGNAFTYRSTLYINDGNGSFSIATAANDLDGVESSSSSFGDVDGDGDLDLVTTGYSPTTGTGTTTLYTNDGNGGFTSTTTELVDVTKGSSSVDDIDGDGDLDLLLTGSASGSVETATLYRNDGSGTFIDTAAGIVGVVDSSSSFGDVDADGDLDLLVTGGNATGVETAILYLNDGTGSFSQTSAGLTGVREGSTSFGDVDGDGDLDLLITGNDGTDQTATLYENQLY